MSEPRILFVYNRPRAMRQEQYLRGECPDDALYAFNALKKRGFDTFFSDTGHEIRGIGKAYKFLDNLMSQRGKRTGFHLWQAQRLLDQIRQADLVFATADSSGLPICLLKKLQLIKTPVIYQTIGLTEAFRDRGIRFSFYRSLLAEAERVIHFSHAEATRLLGEFHLPNDRVRFFPFGVDHEFYDAPSVTEKGPIALGLDPSRDWGLLAEAVGGTEIPIAVHTIPDCVKGFKLPAEFILHEPVSYIELTKLIAEASFVVLPVIENSYTGATITLLSCMAAGKAVIVSHTAAIAEGYGLVDGDHCLLVPPGDKDALRQEILRLSKDADLCRDIGLRAKQHVQKGFTVERMADDLASLFREVLS